MPMSRPSPSPFAHHWDLDPDVMFLNHGSFGATPRVVMEEQREWQRRLEREPVLFIHRELEQHQDVARVSLAQFVGCQPDDLAFVTNATQGVNTVLRSLNFSPGDELLVTDHEYNACRNALEFVAAKSGARIVTAPILFPLAGTARQAQRGRHSEAGTARQAQRKQAARGSSQANQRSGWFCTGYCRQSPKS